jgi:hypothetical protein
VVVVCLLNNERLTRIIHNQAITSPTLCLLLCDSGPGDITLVRISMRINGTVAVQERLREPLRLVSMVLR